MADGPPLLSSPQNTNDSLIGVDMAALCSGLMEGAVSPPPAHQTNLLPTTLPSPPPPAEACDDADGSSTSCWGGLLKDDTSDCVPGFQSGKAHFKNKFCAHCRKGITVPSCRVRALTPDLRSLYQNYLRAGFWKQSPAAIGGGQVRIANNTITCDGPWLVVYRRDCPVPELPWEALPVEWLGEDDQIKFSVAKGTLVPVAEMGVRPGKRANPPSFAANSAPKRKRRANPRPDQSEATLGLSSMPISMRRIASAPVAHVSAVAPTVTLARTNPDHELGVERAAPPALAVAAATALAVPAPVVVSEASTQTTPEVVPVERFGTLPPPTGALLASSAPPTISSATSVPAIRVRVAQPTRPSVAAVVGVPTVAKQPSPRSVVTNAKPSTLIISSPTLSKQSSHGSATTPPGDPAQLAVRLVAAHEHIAAMLEAALRPLSPLRHQLTPQQAATLYEHLNKTRAMVEDAASLARPQHMPSPPTSVSEAEGFAFASLVEAATSSGDV